MAYLERASVDAFALLESDLLRHAAPVRLVKAARRARRDERRHTRMTRALALRHGAQPEAPRAAPPPPVGASHGRSLEEVAVENAREGCARETFGALVGLWQAQHARDPVVRAAMKRIARDETAHAEIAWAVHAWAMRRLGPDARRRVDDALRSEAHALVDGCVGEPEASVVRDAGMPSAEQTRRLSRAWAAAMGLDDERRA
jgi:hypothetical protein